MANDGVLMVVCLNDKQDNVKVMEDLTDNKILVASGYSTRRLRNTRGRSSQHMKS